MKKYIKKISIILIIILLSLTAIFYVKADSGWDSDYGGGSDWGGSDWGSSSWDSDSDYDYDYGGSSGGYSCVGGSFVFALSFIIFFIIYAAVGGNKKSNTTNNISNNNYYPDLIDGDYYRYFGMSKDEFKRKIKENFVNVQESWMNFDYKDLRKLCTDELYNQYKTLLETLKLKNEQNIMSDFGVNKISVYKVEEVNDVMEVSVMLDINFKDYVINSKSNKVVRGSKNIIFNNTYELTFVASKNKKIKVCPSCGASVDVVSSEVCEYCHNTIVQISDELVLSKKKIVSSNKR